MTIKLQQNEDLEVLLQKSDTYPILIFKHSTQCGISSQAYASFNRSITAESLKCAAQKSKFPLSEEASCPTD